MEKSIGIHASGYLIIMEAYRRSNINRLAGQISLQNFLEPINIAGWVNRKFCISRTLKGETSAIQLFLNELVRGICLSMVKDSFIKTT